MDCVCGGRRGRGGGEGRRGRRVVPNLGQAACQPVLPGPTKIHTTIAQHVHEAEDSRLS